MTEEERGALFKSLVPRRFRFLVSEFRYVSKSWKIGNPESRDHELVKYYYSHNQAVRVEITYEIYQDEISVGIDDLLSCPPGGRFSKCWGYRGWGKSIDLRDYIEMKTGHDPMHELLPRIELNMTSREMGKISRFREESLDKNLKQIVTEYSRLLKVHCQHILNGDCTEFRATQKFTSRKYG